jgi:glucosamine--fructose-6-phosphate aminotransferase (isomerizing)
MCGIFGFVNHQNASNSKQQLVFDKLMEAAYWRGKEASGAAALIDKHHVHFIKSDLNGREMVKAKEYANFKYSLEGKSVQAMIGHSRLATHGSQLVHENNQPVIPDAGNLVMVHNGIITNPDVLWQQAAKTTPPPVLDTAALAEFTQKTLCQKPLHDALCHIYNTLEGSASLAVIIPQSSTVFIATNTGSLYYAPSPNGHNTYFASEKIFLQEALTIAYPNTPLQITQLMPQTAALLSSYGVELLSLQNTTHPAVQNAAALQQLANLPPMREFSVYEKKSAATKLYTVKNDINRLRKHDFDYNKIYSLKRCTRCILPVTTPFIEFDQNGVCNYCREHQAIKVNGMDALEAVLNKYRKGTGEPDCLVAFSGGRDSSYGLHFLKKEMGMQPLAYTYDWGMVTDMARRNQARLLGTLGVEHILVSADITMKRKHIRENIRAWMKRPHLGMVPLFMEGDKQCEFYADQIMKKYKLDLMFFFRGNELERDEFKTGHCGVKDADPGGVIHHLEPLKKVKLMSFYASEYFMNPSYFNSSFFDTALGFFATYIQPHNYLFLWHYIKWDEQKIISTLRNNYNWETSPETKATWRTDDGTSAFYNYIYYMVQGYTENESFRSRQIREGLLDRATALALVHEENKPRYEALQWYFDMVGLDGDEVLTVVDNIKKLY